MLLFVHNEAHPPLIRGLDAYTIVRQIERFILDDDLCCHVRSKATPRGEIVYHRLPLPVKIGYGVGQGHLIVWCDPEQG